MSQAPKISVITPSLNQGRFLQNCIDSVLSQEYPNLEYIIIDGGSRDESIDIIKNHDNLVDYWISEPDKGQTDAINKGFKRASGDLVAWLNADDFYLPGALQKAAQAYNLSPESSFFFGDGHRVDEQGTYKSNFFPQGEVLFERNALIFGLNYILQPSTFINLKALKKVGYLDSSLHYGMDSDLWMKLSSVAIPSTINDALSASREYGETKTSTGMFERAEELRAISARHSGMELTPGALCYYLDTLHRYSLTQENTYNWVFRRTGIEPFWNDVSSLFRNYSAGIDGFPVKGDVPHERVDITLSTPEYDTDGACKRDLASLNEKLQNLANTYSASKEIIFTLETQLKEMTHEKQVMDNKISSLEEKLNVHQMILSSALIRPILKLHKLFKTPIAKQLQEQKK